MRGAMRRSARVARLLRVGLSYYVMNGLSAALGLFFISGAMRLWLGPFAAAVGAIGVIVVVPPDQPGPRRGKFRQMLPAVAIGIPLFFGVRELHADPRAFALLLVPATFVSFLAAAWGRRGVPVSMSAMFAIVFGLAVPAQPSGEVVSTIYFAVGAVAYLLFAVAANALLNRRYRVQVLAETLLTFADLMRVQADQSSRPVAEELSPNPIGRLLRGQAEFADQLQSARDILLETPNDARRLQLAGMLVRVLELRDRLLAAELEADVLIEYADEIEWLADALLLGNERRARNVPAQAPTAPHGGAAAMRAEIARLYALASGESDPELPAIRATWQMFMSAAGWSFEPLRSLWTWDAPPLRHAIRASMAVLFAYGISLLVPWRTHAYWILLSIVVVLRGSLAQTLERRNNRVLGTLFGSVAAGLLLAANTPALIITGATTLAQGVAHAFAVKRYLVTAMAATVLALLQAHLLNAATNPAFQALERIADTIIGVGLAWAFSYVMPSWESTQIPALIERALQAQARHARLSLDVGQFRAVDARPELQWRLARKEAYDSLSALVQATQRCLAEPRAVRPPLPPLGRFVAHSYQLLAQLTAVKTVLTLRREQLDTARLGERLQCAEERVAAALGIDGAAATPPVAAAAAAANESLSLPGASDEQTTPWLLRRLDLAMQLATDVRDAAGELRGAREIPTAASADRL